MLKSVKGIVIHWAANAGATARANRNYFEGLKDQVPPNDKCFASSHYVIGLRGEIIRCVPDREICYHMTWNVLSEKFDQTLNELSERLRTSEANGQKLTDLSGELSRQNEDLKNYNRHIGERMQERDEDMAAAYDKIDNLEKTVLKAIIAITVMGALIIGAVAFKVLRLMRIIPI